MRHIKEDKLTKEELTQVYHDSKLPLKKLFNTSGKLYKELQLKDKLPHKSEEEQLTLLATDGMLVKRPILIDGNTVLVGFKQAEYDILK